MAAGSPLNGGAHHLLGYLALMDGRFDAAEAHLRQTVEQLPDTPGARTALGDLAARAGRRDEALHWYEAERARFGASAALDGRIRGVSAGTP